MVLSYSYCRESSWKKYSCYSLTIIPLNPELWVTRSLCYQRPFLMFRPNRGVRQSFERGRRQYLFACARIQRHLLQDRTLVPDALHRRRNSRGMERRLDYYWSLSGTIFAETESIHRWRYFAQVVDGRARSVPGENRWRRQRRVVLPKGRIIQTASWPHLPPPLLSASRGFRRKRRLPRHHGANFLSSSWRRDKMVWSVSLLQVFLGLY